MFQEIEVIQTILVPLSVSVLLMINQELVRFLVYIGVVLKHVVHSDHTTHEPVPLLSPNVSALNEAQQCSESLEVLQIIKITVTQPVLKAVMHL